eukprot:7640-Heterococcus_DN1.PRE.5
MSRAALLAAAGAAVLLPRLPLLCSRPLPSPSLLVSSSLSERPSSCAAAASEAAAAAAATSAARLAVASPALFTLASGEAAAAFDCLAFGEAAAVETSSSSALRFFLGLLMVLMLQLMLQRAH